MSSAIGQLSCCANRGAATDTQPSSVPSSDRVFDMIHRRMSDSEGSKAVSEPISKIARDVGYVAIERDIGVPPDGYRRSATSDSTS
jgi:hypothetical protein